MISRIWHGYTTPENAPVYQKIVLTEVIPGIEAKDIPGYQRISLFRRDLEDEVEFITVMWFDSLESVIAFQGEDYEVAYVPPQAQAVMTRWDLRSQHYDVIAQR